MLKSRIYGNHKVYNISYHIIWIPKYRKKILVGHVKKYLLKVLKNKTAELKITLSEVEIMSDHIHLFIKSNPNLSVSFIIQQLKGYSSYMLRKKFKFLNKYKSLWTNSYYVETIGLISEETVKRYIKMQTKNK